MHCEITPRTVITLELDMPAFAALQAALTYYVERAMVDPGSHVKALMWQLTHAQIKMAKDAPTKVVETDTKPPQQTLPPPNPLDEIVSIATDEVPAFPEAEWDEKTEDEEDA